MKTANDEKLSTIFIKELAQQMSLTSFLQTSAQIWPEKSNCIMNIWELFKYILFKQWQQIQIPLGPYIKYEGGGAEGLCGGHELL